MKATTTLLIFVAVLATSALAHDITFETLASLDAQDLFAQFMKSYNKVYEDQATEQYRFGIFKENLKVVAKYQKADPGAVYGVTQFSDLSQEEFAKFYLTLKPEQAKVQASETYSESRLGDGEQQPSSWDWREHGAVNAIKNQEQCGSCWAFSATCNIEGQYFIDHGTLYSLSEQELVDCDTNDQGCGGGWMYDAYEWLEKAGGQMTEAEYPYTGNVTACVFNISEVVAKVKTSLNVTTSEIVIAEATWMVGPLATAVDATGWQFYKSGISNDPYCTSSVNHGVNIIGYGVDMNTNENYWIVRNCWGTTWGEEGYMKLIRGVGRCGINEYCSSAQLY
jgi:cathepsin F